MKRKKIKKLVQPDVINELVELRLIKFLHFVRMLFLEIDKADAKTRRSIFRKVLTSLLKLYSSVAVLTEKRKSQDIMNYFKEPEKDQVELGCDLIESLDDMLEFFEESQGQVRSPENFMKPAVYGILCMYIVLAKSDQRGSNMCKNLGKEMAERWGAYTAKQVTASYLAKGVKDQERVEGILECYYF